MSLVYPHFLLNTSVDSQLSLYYGYSGNTTGLERSHPAAGRELQRRTFHYQAIEDGTLGASPMYRFWTASAMNCCCNRSSAVYSLTQTSNLRIRVLLALIIQTRPLSRGQRPCFLAYSTTPKYKHSSSCDQTGHTPHRYPYTDPPQSAPPGPRRRYHRQSHIHRHRSRRQKRYRASFHRG